jgi:hypothetical protein
MNASPCLAILHVAGGRMESIDRDPVPPWAWRKAEKGEVKEK